jgi:hypothetical protein
MHVPSISGCRRLAARGFSGLAALAAVAALAGPAQAAKSAGCENGGYQLVNLSSGAVVASAGTGAVDRTIAAGARRCSPARCPTTAA